MEEEQWLLGEPVLGHQHRYEKHAATTGGTWYCKPYNQIPRTGGSPGCPVPRGECLNGLHHCIGCGVLGHGQADCGKQTSRNRCVPFTSVAGIAGHKRPNKRKQTFQPVVPASRFCAFPRSQPKKAQPQPQPQERVKSEQTAPPGTSSKASCSSDGRPPRMTPPLHPPPPRSPRVTTRTWRPPQPASPPPRPPPPPRATNVEAKVAQAQIGSAQRWRTNAPGYSASPSAPSSGKSAATSPVWQLSTAVPSSSESVLAKCRPKCTAKPMAVAEAKPMPTPPRMTPPPAVNVPQMDLVYWRPQDFKRHGFACLFQYTCTMMQKYLALKKPLVIDFDVRNTCYASFTSENSKACWWDDIFVQPYVKTLEGDVKFNISTVREQAIKRISKWHDRHHDSAQQAAMEALLQRARDMAGERAKGKGKATAASPSDLGINVIRPDPNSDDLCFNTSGVWGRSQDGGLNVAKVKEARSLSFYSLDATVLSLRTSPTSPFTLYAIHEHSRNSKKA